MVIIRFDVGDVLEMKKDHPCHSNKMEVLKVGSDIHVKCLGCGHDMIVPRVKLEKNIKHVLAKSNKIDT